MKREMQCYLCGSTDCKKIHDTIRYNLPPKPYRCNRCGFVFLHPLMTPDKEKEFYKNKYWGEYDYHDPEDRWRTSIPESIQRVSRFKEYYSKDTRVLEIGCASGYFLFNIKKYVKTATGVELTKEFVHYAKKKGLDVRESFEDIPDMSYDLIFMFHVLEHVQDPVLFLKEVRKKMSETGKLIIEVPNVDDILVTVYKIKSHLDFYWEIAHNYYFSRETLGKVLEKAGLKYKIYPLQRYDLSNHIIWMQTGKPGGQGYYNSIFSQSLLNEYENCLKERFICDTIYAISEKNNK